MSVRGVRQALVRKLQDMQTLRAVYDYEASNQDGSYPFATVTLRAGEASFESTSHNLRRRRFAIRIYQERTKAGQGPDNAEEISAQILDELEVAFDLDTTLSGSCKYVMPVTWDASYVDREHDSRILEVVAEAVELVESWK